MIYLIEGEEELFIRKKISELLKNNNSELIKFDGNDKSFSIQELVDACNSNSLFNEKITVLVKDPDFLCKKVDDSKLESLYDYITNPLYETDLIFYTFNNLFNGKLKAYKELCKNAQIFIYKTLDYKNFNNYAFIQIKEANLDISKDAAYKLVNICKRSAILLDQNLSILKNYPDKIDVDTITKLCTESDDNDTFDLINALTNKDVSKAISLERKMIDENSSISGLISLLSGQLRFLYQIAYYQSIGKSKNEILEITKCNEYRYTKSLESLSKLSLDKIIELLNKLSELDIKCKNEYSLNDVDRFEFFILELLKKNN